MVTRILVSVELAIAARSQEVIIVVADANPTLVLCDDAILESQSQIPGEKMHLANSGGVIAVLAEDLRPSFDPACSIVGSEELLILQHAVFNGVHPRDERDAGGNAQRMSRVGIAVQYAFVGEAVNVGCINKIGAVTTEKVPPQLIGHNEDDVWLVNHGILLHFNQLNGMSKLVRSLLGSFVSVATAQLKKTRTTHAQWAVRLEVADHSSGKRNLRFVL
jgi:hypothetical protein